MSAERVRRVAGQVLSERRKGVVTWQARIAADRNRLEVVGFVPPSASVTVIEPLSEPELLELLGETAALDDSLSGPAGVEGLKRDAREAVAGA